MEDRARDVAAEDMYCEAKASKFHFKSTSASRSERRNDKDRIERSSERTKKRSRSDWDDKARRKRKHRRKTPDHEHHTATTRNGDYCNPEYRNRESIYDGLEDPCANYQGKSAHDAFRESLLDALADDEGAAYWEGVYGQPIHIYPDSKSRPDGELERMNEEEYADFVRSKMWERTHQHIVEEREARARARQEQKEQRHKLEANIEREELERERIGREVEESLRRGEQRKRAKEIEVAWERYIRKWDQLENVKSRSNEQVNKVRELIPWPVITGRVEDVQKDQIEHFMRSSSGWKHDSVTFLKVERVRWHPDKMQQRFGQHINSEMMKSITVVFQVINRLWNER